jgi:hypothetical protein
MPEVKWPLGRPRKRWIDNSEINLSKIGMGGKGWIDLAQDRHHGPISSIMF